MEDRLRTMNIHTLPQSAITRCRFYILVPSHYREDNTCKCDDPQERAKMIREWGYKPSNFDGIPLQEEKP